MFDSPTSLVSFYRHSGKTPLLGLFLLGLAGSASVLVLGLVYGFLIRIIPFIYLNALIVIGYVFVVGVILAQVAKFSKIRNMVVLGLTGFIFGLLAEYVGWVSWIATMAGEVSYLYLLFFPADVLMLIQAIAEEGAWTISGTTPTGVILYIVWFIEACGVIGGITYLAVTSLADTPFCEESNTWADKRSVLGIFMLPENLAQFKELVMQRGVNALDTLRPALRGAAEFLFLELYECPQCQNFLVLNIKKMKLTRNSKGGLDQKSSPVVSNLVINPVYLPSLRKIVSDNELARAT